MYTNNDLLIFRCPHCDELVVVNRKELNCCIFRHGVYKDTFKQIDPHSPKEICDKLAQESKIYGCGKPFEYIKSHPPKIVKCEYK